MRDPTAQRREFKGLGMVTEGQSVCLERLFEGRSVDARLSGCNERARVRRNHCAHLRQVERDDTLEDACRRTHAAYDARSAAKRNDGKFTMGSKRQKREHFRCGARRLLS